MEYRSALEFLNSFINYERRVEHRYDERRFNLERMRRLLDSIGSPHLAHKKVIHIAGTKGKGSTACMISTILAEAGYKVGLYTSPHLVTPRERFRINGKMISQDELSQLVERIQPGAEEMRHSDEMGDLTFFELYTALGFLWFASEGADIWVLETGLGGRLDATNVIDSDLVVITPIGLDHTQILGDTLEAIAREKAGIIKSDAPVVCAPQKEGVIGIISERCRRFNSPFLRVDEIARSEREVSSPAGERFSAEVMGLRYEDLFLPLLGEHQIINALTAITAVEVMRGEGFGISPKAIRSGLARVKWPCRIQVVREKPIVILDVAHNPDSIRALRRTIQERFRYEKLILIFGVSSDKDVEGMGYEFAGFADMTIATRASDNTRMIPPAELKLRLEGILDHVLAAGAVKEAFSEALSMAGPDDLICVTGSFYHVGELLKDMMCKNMT